MNPTTFSFFGKFPNYLIIVKNVIYNPIKTKFLKEAQEIGAKTLNGIDMLIYQAILSNEIWLGKKLLHQINFNDIKKSIMEKIC